MYVATLFDFIYQTKYIASKLVGLRTQRNLNIKSRNDDDEIMSW